MSTAAVTEPVLPVVPIPRVRIHDHIIILICAALATFYAAHVVSGWYFVWDHGVFKTWWDGAISNSNLRHDIRDVAEGLIGGYAGQLVAWKHWKYMRRTGGVMERLESKIPLLDRLRQWGERRPFRELVVSAIVSLPFAAPGFIGMYYLLGWLTKNPAIHHAAGHITASHPGLWTRTVHDVPANWQEKLMGFSASLLFGRHAMSVAFDDTQGWFAGRHASGRHMRPWWLLNYRYRVRLARKGAVLKSRHGFRQNVAMMGGLALSVPFAVMGYLALTYAANGLPMPYGLNF